MPVPKGNLKLEDSQRIRMNYEYLIEEIDAKNLTPFLYSRGVLDKDDSTEIESAVRRSVRNKLLLDAILRSGPGASYNLFIEALKQNYEHVVKILEETRVSSTDTLPKPYQWFDGVNDDIKMHVIKDGDASRIATKLGMAWELLMYRMGLNQIDIDREKKQNSNDIICITHLIIKWRQRVVKDATVNKLMSLLMELEDSGSMTIDWEGLRDIIETKLSLDRI